MGRVEGALESFEKGFSCSQAVLSAYGKGLKLDSEIALRIGTPFGGGMGRMGRTCGAVTGGFMALGLKYGTSDAEDADGKEKTYDLVREFTRRFEERHGSIVCNDLLGCDISSPDGRAEAQKREMFTTLCPKLVRSACEILEEIL